MLTSEAYDDRQWSKFPALRRIINAGPLPQNSDGVTSVSDSALGQLQRILEIALLARESEQDILNSALTIDPREILGELRHLDGELRKATLLVEHAMRGLSNLTHDLHRMSSTGNAPTSGFSQG